jgi:hypothetical protein
MSSCSVVELANDEGVDLRESEFTKRVRNSLKSSGAGGGDSELELVEINLAVNLWETSKLVLCRGVESDFKVQASVEGLGVCKYVVAYVEACVGGEREQLVSYPVQALLVGSSTFDELGDSIDILHNKRDVSEARFSLVDGDPFIDCDCGLGGPVIGEVSFVVNCGYARVGEISSLGKLFGKVGNKLCLSDFCRTREKDARPCFHT